MKSLALLLFSILLNISAFAQNGVYLFGHMENAPGTTFDISVVIYSSPPVTTQFTVNPDGDITNGNAYWVDLPSPDWTHFEVLYPTCNNETNILSVQADSLPNMIDVSYVIDYCPGNNEVLGCTDPEAMNYDQNATEDDGSCLYDEVGCVPVNIDIFCVDTTSIEYDMVINQDPFCCENSWDEICQGLYENVNGPVLENCVPDSTDIYGCTDPDALNYDPNATVDDGSCQFGCAFNLIELSIYPQNSGDEISWSLTQNGEVIDGGGNYGNDYVYSEWLCIEDGCFTLEMIDSDGDNPEGAWFTIGDFDNNTLASGSLSENGYEIVDFGVNSECDSTEVIYGCTNPAASNYNPEATEDDGSCEFAPCSIITLIFEVPDTYTSATWSIQSIYNPDLSLYSEHFEGTYDAVELCLPDDCYNLTLSIDSVGELGETGYLLHILDDFGDIDLEYTGSVTDSISIFEFGVNTNCDSINVIYGCTDPEAVNYDPNATVDDGTCQYDNNVANDLCADATELQPGTQLISNLDAVNNENVWGECWAFGNGEGEQSSIWYSFTTPDEPATIHIEASPDGTNTLTDTQFGLFEECGGEMIYCDGNAGQGLFSAFTFGCGELQTNTTYILMIDGYYGDMGTCYLTYEVETGCVLGCTDPEALNYDPNATVNDGSCEYECGELSFEFVPYGNPPNGCIGQTVATYTGADQSGTLVWDYGAGTPPLTSNDMTGFYQYSENGTYLVCATYYTDNCTLQYCDTLVTYGCNEEFYGCTNPQAINYDPNATIDDGSCIFENDSCETNEVYVSISTGPWADEISWNIVQDNIEVAGGSGYENNNVYTYLLCLDDGCYTFEMFDSYGDGWHGGNFSILMDGMTLAEGTLDTGEYGAVNFSVNTDCGDDDCVEVGENFCVDTNSEAYYITVTQDSFCCDTAWDQICQDAYVDFGGIVGEDCDIYGCTDPEALNFHPEATADDGSCEYSCTDIHLGFDFFNGAPADSSQMTWTIVNNNSEVVEYGFFYNWAPQYDFCLEDGCYTLTVFDVASEWDGLYNLFDSNQTLAQGTFNGDESTFITTFGVNAEDCEDEDIYGCTDPNADNYNPAATIDDGSCEYEFECAISFTVSPDTTGAQVIWITPSDNIYNAVSVEWDFGDGNTSNDLFPVHTYEGDGPYMLCLTATFEDNGSFCEITYCAELTDEMINPPGMQSEGFSINVVDPLGTTGVEETEWISELTLWPNPATDQVQVQFVLLNNSNVNLEMYDAIGQVVRQSSVAAHSGQNLVNLEVAGLTPGMYVIRLTGNNEQMTTRVVVQ